MEKTLGGDRLGSGKKMKVHLHNYERSTHDLGYVFRTTMSAGTLVPFLSIIGLPGDTFDINLQAFFNTHPTIGPLFGSFKVQLDTFLCPIRLYNSMLHNNTLNIGRNMSQIKLPQIEMTALQQSASQPAEYDIDNSQINPSCLLSYLGLRGIGFASTADGNKTRQFNAVPILAYWEIYKCYYANKQEEIGAVIHTPSIAIVTTVSTITIDTLNLVQAPGTSSRALNTGGTVAVTGTGPVPLAEQIVFELNSGQNVTLDQLLDNIVIVGNNFSGLVKDQFDGLNALRWRYIDATTPQTGKPLISTFPLTKIDDMKKAILALWNTAAPLVINTTGLEPYKWLHEQPGGIPNSLSSQEGLALKTYQSDLFNNWLKTENIDAITTQTAISTAGANFTIDQLNLSKKIYDMLNRINVSGGSYDDWIDAVYTHEKYTRAESPMYMGGLIKELVFQEVISNSQAETTDGAQPLGSLAGKGTLSDKHKGGNIIIKVDEPSYIIGIVSLTPRVDYSQGNQWDMHLKTLDDLHKPALDQIGFQDLITEQMAWWDTGWNGTWIQKSAGKQPAWINYMTAVNKCLGNFAIKNNEMFMTLNRRYERVSGGETIKDLTTYIDPSKFNFIFAETALDAQNFWCQIGVDMTARRKMSGKLMPNL